MKAFRNINISLKTEFEFRIMIFMATPPYPVFIVV
jgi:hypothetical protein